MSALTPQERMAALAKQSPLYLNYGTSFFGTTDFGSGTIGKINKNIWEHQMLDRTVVAVAMSPWTKDMLVFERMEEAKYEGGNEYSLSGLWARIKLVDGMPNDLWVVSSEVTRQPKLTVPTTATFGTTGAFSTTNASKLFESYKAQMSAIDQVSAKFGDLSSMIDTGTKPNFWAQAKDAVSKKRGRSRR